ncbi:hypothetical protein ACQPXB_43715 [Amycolatopsis sp. CA-161197]|uniref:hypothetical protein n=1 Tax=Amycolatopsis sp. CA-161197 TaxID=3239922 RepID=UPI003D8E3079
MTIAALVYRYTDAERAGTVPAWTDFSDVGKSFGGEVLTLEAYEEVEGRHLAFLRRLLALHSVDELEVRTPTVLTDSWAHLRSGLRFPADDALAMIRSMWRGSGLDCAFSSPEGVVIWQGFDYYIAVEVPDAAALSLAGEFGLRWFPVDPLRPDFSDGDDGPLAIDPEFFAHLSVATPTVVLERWASGELGRQWHAVADEADVVELRRDVEPNTVLAAFVGAPLDSLPETDAPGRICHVVPEPDGPPTALWDNDLNLVW